MEKVAATIPGYGYGQAARSPVSLADFERLERTAGFTADDERHLRLAGEVLAGQTRKVIERWRGIIAENPELARHSKSPDGQAIPRYSERSGLRFEQWILDTCLRPYDQAWLDYQHEIALRHTTRAKNRTDGAESTPYVPLRDVIAFVAVINDTIKPFLAARGHAADVVDKMHRAWCKSVLLQAALWAQPYTDPAQAPNQW